MHLKRFRRETVQEALRAAREELGPGALVLATRVVAAPGARGWFGRRHVEVTAAAERPLVSDFRQPAAESGPHLRVVASGSNEDGRARKREQRAVASLAAQLQATGLDPSIAHDVAHAHPTPHRRGATVHTLRRTLADQLATLAADDTG